MDKTAVGGLIANIIIGSASDYYEARRAGEAGKASYDLNEDDKNNGINVMSQTK